MDRFTYELGYTMNGADRPWYTILDDGDRITEVHDRDEAKKLCEIMNQLWKDSK